MRLSARVFAGAAVVGAACGYAIFSSAGPIRDPSCGMGVPPGSPGFAAYEASQAAEAERNGFVRVCDAGLARFDLPSGLKPMVWTKARLAFEPVELAGTPFEKLESLGGVYEAVNDIKSRLYRSFRTADGRTVTLFEHDMSADGVRTYRNPKDEPERINGLPARLTVMQASPGKAVSVLSWKEGRRYYEIWMDANIVLENRRPQLFALAASLPKSVPARLHEPELTPEVLGPDGLPIEAPPPPTISIPLSG